MEIIHSLVDIIKEITLYGSQCRYHHENVINYQHSIAVIITATEIRKEPMSY